MATLLIPWAPLEVGAEYRIGGGFGNGTVGLGGCVTMVGRTVRDASTVIHFANIARTASMAVSWKSQRLAGTSLSTADKKCMECVILSSNVNVG